jgi:hypothetical protein
VRALRLVGVGDAAVRDKACLLVMAKVTDALEAEVRCNS